MSQDQKFALRLPGTLYAKLVKEAGRRTTAAGNRVSANTVMVDILETHFRRGSPKRRKQ